MINRASGKIHVLALLHTFYYKIFLISDRLLYSSCVNFSAGSFLIAWTLTINTDCTEEFDKLLLTYNMSHALPLYKQTVLCA